MYCSIMRTTEFKIGFLKTITTRVTASRKKMASCWRLASTISLIFMPMGKCHQILAPSSYTVKVGLWSTNWALKKYRLVLVYTRILNGEVKAIRMLFSSHPRKLMKSLSSNGKIWNVRLTLTRCTQMETTTMSNWKTWWSFSKGVT